MLDIYISCYDSVLLIQATQAISIKNKAHHYSWERDGGSLQLWYLYNTADHSSIRFYYFCHVLFILLLKATCSVLFIT